MLSLNNVLKEYEDTSINLNNISFKKGTSYLILGASGSGKSTMLNMIGGFVKPDRGTITLTKEGIDTQIASLTPKEVLSLRRDTIGYILQDFQLFEDFSVKDNLELKQSLLKNKTKDIKELLDLVGLSNKLNSKVKNLSGGEKQRVAIARTLLSDYDVLLCDEPTGSLNKTIANDLMSLIVKTHKKCNNILIVVSHDESMSKYFDKVIHF